MARSSSKVVVTISRNSCGLVNLNLEPEPEPGEAAQLVAGQLSVLRAMQLKASPRELSLEGWHMTEALMGAFKGLPHWQCSIRFDVASACWPLRPEEYERLAELIPTSFISIWLYGLPVKVHAGVQRAFDSHRKRLGLLPIPVKCFGKSSHRE